MLRSPRLVILALAVVLLPVLLFVVLSVGLASAQQTWYFSDVDSGETDGNGRTVYVMYKGVSTNNSGTYVQIPGLQSRIWIADEAVAIDEVVFERTGSCYWSYVLGVEGGSPNDLETKIGGFNPDTSSFYGMDADGDGNNYNLTLQEGHYLAMYLRNKTFWALNVRVEHDLPSPDHGTSLTWKCDEPPYPVPDIGAWIMFSAGAALVGFVIWRCRKRLLYSSL